MTIRRAIAYAAMTNVLLSASLPYSHAQVPTAGTQIDATQADQGLFEQAVKAMKKSKYADARTLFKRLITNYPDSNYVARAKLSIADAWYAEGNFKQALMEYQDFVTFFPSRPEVAKAKLKIDIIQKRENP